MANINNIVVVESSTTGGKRGLLISVADNGQSLTIRRDTTYDATGDVEIGVTIQNVLPTPRSSLYIGADWNQLQGAGQTFDLSPAGNNEINILLYARVVGAFARANRVPLSAPSTLTPIDPGHGNTLAATLEIGEDYYIRPDFTQINDYYVSLRPIDRPTDFHGIYTTKEDVINKLGNPKNPESLWNERYGEAGGRLEQAILSAVDVLEQWMGRTCRPAVQGSTIISVPIGACKRSGFRLRIPDVIPQGASLIQNENPVNADYYRFVTRGFASSNEVVLSRPLPNTRDLTLTGMLGLLPSTANLPDDAPSDLRDYACEVAARIFGKANRSHVAGAGPGSRYLPSGVPMYYQEVLKRC